MAKRKLDPNAVGEDFLEATHAKDFSEAIKPPQVRAQVEDFNRAHSSVVRSNGKSGLER